MAKMNSLQALRVAIRMLQESLDKSEAARDHLRQQSNELKALALVLVRHAKQSAVRLAAASSTLSEPLSSAQADGLLGEAIRIPRADWDLATHGPDALAGKGVVLLVMPQENGDVLVDLGDVEKEDPQPKAEA